MSQLLTLLMCAAAFALTSAANQTGLARPLLDNARVRVVKVATGLTAPPGEVRAAPGVIITIPRGDAEWLTDATAALKGDKWMPAILVQPTGAPGRPAPPQSSQPGGAQFTGMSFRPIFENETVRVIRARMDVDAREGFHTHAADTVVVHLSGGEIEDTADGRTVVNRWKPGDVEFEAAGSSHSARNVGKAVDVVLVALK